MLQPRVRVERDGRGKPTALVDDLLGRTITLSAGGAAVVGALEDAADHAEAVERALAMGVAWEVVHHALRGLMRLNLVRGSGDAIRAALQQPRTDLVQVEGSRFECQGSGACCQGHRLGPLSNDDVALVRELAGRPGFPLDAGTPWMEQRDGKRYLAQHTGRCVFLNDHHQCRLHTTFGATQKPHFCRDHPLQRIRTVDGVRILNRNTCSTVLRSSRRGLLLVDQPPQADEAEPLFHPMVRLGDSMLDYGHFICVVKGALESVPQADRGTLAAVAHVARCLVNAEAALDAFSLEPAQPDATVAALRGVPADCPGNTAALEELWQALASNVLGPLSYARSELHSAARELAPTLVDVPTRFTPLPGNADAFWVMLQNDLLGPQALVQDQPWPALLRLGLVHATALAHAQRHGADAASRGHMLALRLYSVMDELFVGHAAHTAVILGALAARAD